MRLLDRYVLRNFLQVYFYCIAGFVSIWLIFDVSDNISTFIDQHVALSLVARYYGTQIPQVFIILLPVSLLLSLLFALGRMSRSNEIVSMLTAGVSLPRVLLPVTSSSKSSFPLLILNTGPKHHSDWAARMCALNS